MPKTKTVQQRAGKAADKLGALIDNHHTDLTAEQLLALGKAVGILTVLEQK